MFKMMGLFFKQNHSHFLLQEDLGNNLQLTNSAVILLTLIDLLWSKKKKKAAHQPL